MIWYDSTTPSQYHHNAIHHQDHKTKQTARSPLRQENRLISRRRFKNGSSLSQVDLQSCDCHAISLLICNALPTNAPNKPICIHVPVQVPVQKRPENAYSSKTRNGKLAGKNGEGSPSKNILWMSSISYWNSNCYSYEDPEPRTVIRIKLRITVPVSCAFSWPATKGQHA